MTAAKTPKDPKPTKDKPSQSRSYVVLARPDEASAFIWEEIGNFSAVTPEEARKQAAAENGEKYTTFVAVATRSWSPASRNLRMVQEETWS